MTDKDQAFEDRSVKLETTFDGAGVLSGDLSPECAAVVTAVLDALSAPAGAEDTRSQAQRYHDALQQAMQRLVTAGLLPERAGQPVKALVHISLADLMVLDGSSALLEEWTSRVRAQWAAHRAEASAGGSDGGAWLDGDAATAMACDAALAPIVTGDVNPAAMDDLVRLCVQLDRLRHHHAGDGGQGAPAPDTTLAWEALEQAIIGKAVDLLSGPGGLASFLRRRQLGARLGGPSLPLDIGYSETIPASIRNAVILRDQHCQWAGRCNQPASACQVHHVKHKKNGGKTSVRDCVLLCWFHHQVVVHRWGWTLVLNPDGTTTALEPGQDQGPAQSQPTRPGRVRPPGPQKAIDLDDGIGAGHVEVTGQSHLSGARAVRRMRGRVPETSRADHGQACEASHHRRWRLAETAGMPRRTAQGSRRCHREA